MRLQVTSHSQGILASVVDDLVREKRVLHIILLIRPKVSLSRVKNLPRAENY